MTSVSEISRRRVAPATYSVTLDAGSMPLKRPIVVNPEGIGVTRVLPRK